MIAESEEAAGSSIGSLVGGIVSDAQRLVKQHLDLFRHEVREDFRKSKRAALVMAGAHGLALGGCTFVVAMLVGLLAWAVPQVPWWIWSGILGAALLLLAGAVYGIGKRLLSSMNPLPQQTILAIKEDLQWPQE